MHVRPSQFPEHPTFVLGAAGFTPQQRSALAGMLAERGGAANWQLGAFGDATAWLIAGAKVRVLSGDAISVYPATPTERMLRLNLTDANRPVAFAAPLPEGLEAACQLDPDDPAGLDAALCSMEQWLAPLRARFAFGRDVVRYGDALRRGVFHVFWKERLLGVFDFRISQAAIAPFACAEMVAQAEWRKRPASAGEFPPRFIPVSTRELAWTYVRHTDADLLPPAYRSRTLYYRGPARVPVQWLSDPQLLLLRELAQAPDNLAGLSQRTGLGRPQVERALACLYYASCVTSTPGKAGCIDAPDSRSHGQPSLPSLGAFGDDDEQRTVRVIPRHEATVPARLGL